MIVQGSWVLTNETWGERFLPTPLLLYHIVIPPEDIRTHPINPAGALLLDSSL